MELIKLTNLIRKQIRKQRYKDGKDPFEEFLRIKKEYKLPPVTKGTIVITPVRVSPVSNLLEGLVAYKYRMMGYRVVALMCGQKLKKCENLNLNSKVNLACPLCLSEQEKFLEVFEVEGVYLKDLISSQEQHEIDQLVAATDIKKIENFEYKGVQIGVHVEAAIQRHYLTSLPDLDKNMDTCKKLLQSSLIMTQASFKLFEKYKPELVFSSHGIYSMWGPIIEVANKLNIHSIVWGRGYVGKGNLLLSHNKSYLLERNSGENETWHLNDLTSEERNRLDNYFAQKRNPNSTVDYVSYYSAGSGNEQLDLRAKLGIPKGKKIMAHYPNIPWDGQAFCKTKEFPTIRKFCSEMFGWFERNPDVYLIIRIHPAEKARKDNLAMEGFTDIVKEFYPNKLPENVKLIEAEDSITSYQVKDICDAGITFGSTLSLEFSLEGWPMIQCGLRETSNRNIVFDAFTREDMIKYMDMVARGELHMTEEMKKRAFQFAYYWVFKRHIPEKLVELKSLRFQQYNFTNIEEFEKMESLNWIVDKSLSGDAFIWEGNA